jgi:molecular chaperone GrpE
MSKKKENIENVKKELKVVKEKAEECLNNWKRAQADYLNLKRRIEEEKRQVVVLANRNLVLQILPVLDNFQRAFEHIPSEYKNSDWIAGIKHLEKQLVGIVEHEGLERILTKGQEFDPRLHEAVLSEKREGAKKGIILEELEAGYKLKDKVIKAAQVKVAK